MTYIHTYTHKQRCHHAIFVILYSEGV